MPRQAGDEIRDQRESVVLTLRDSLGGSRWLAVDRDDQVHVVLFADIARKPLPSRCHPALLDWADASADADSTTRTLYRPYFDSTLEAPPSRDEALAAGRRLAEALSALHHAGAVFGPLDSTNVVLRPGRPATLVEPLGRGSTVADVAGLSAVVMDWLDGYPISDGLTEMLGLGMSGEIAAADLRDGLDDEMAGGVVVVPRALDARKATAEPALGEQQDFQVQRLDSERASQWSVWMPVSIAAGLIAVAGLLYVLFWLPDTVPAPVVVAEVEPEPEVVEPAPEPPTEQELARLLADRELAQAALDRFIQLQLDVNERGVEHWGSAEFAAAVDAAREADKPFRQQDFSLAAQMYGVAADLMQAVAELGDDTLAGALASGARALENEDSDLASRSFELALKIDAENAVATAGLARASTLDQAVIIRDQALAAEDELQWELAAERWRELKALDPALVDTDAALAEVAAAINSRDFRAAMSDGLAALDAADWGEAQRSLQRAASLSPNDPTPRAHLADIERIMRQSAVSSHRQRVIAAMAEERWEDAVRHLDAMALRDANLQFVNEHRATAKARLALANELERFTSDPASWWSDEGRDSARELLSRARQARPEGPELISRRDQLANQIAAASQPVSVTLRSDSTCQVVVYKVARLGQFGERELELKPGTYTVVATRDGYRDVRKEVLVPAGQSPEPVELICEEPV